MTNRQYNFISAAAREANRGFTLLEVLVVITIIALVLGVTAANFSGSNESAKLRAESRKLISHIRYTRDRALTESRIFSISVTDNGLGYQVPHRCSPVGAS